MEDIQRVGYYIRKLSETVALLRQAANAQHLSQCAGSTLEQAHATIGEAIAFNDACGQNPTLEHLLGEATGAANALTVTSNLTSAIVETAEAFVTEPAVEQRGQILARLESLIAALRRQREQFRKDQREQLAALREAHGIGAD